VEDLIGDVCLMTRQSVFEDVLEEGAVDFFGPLDMHEQLGRSRGGNEPSAH